MCLYASSVTCSQLEEKVAVTITSLLAPVVSYNTAVAPHSLSSFRSELTVSSGDGAFWRGKDALVQ